MSCKRCPHHVRHGQLAADAKTVEFLDICGLKVKAIEKPEDPAKEKAVNIKKVAATKIPIRAKPKRYPKLADCIHVPFGEKFEYKMCEVYIETFKVTHQKNDVIPTKDFQYSDALSGTSITDMELL